jgi:hypothetical protein
MGYKSKTYDKGYGIMMGNMLGNPLRTCWKQNDNFMGTHWEQQKSNTTTLPPLLQNHVFFMALATSITISMTYVTE